jgi:hypothetical protein
MPVGERIHRVGAFAGVALSFGVALAGTALSSPAAAAQGWATRYALTGGAEYFSWREYDGGGSRLLEETGPRYFVGLEAETRMSNGWTYGFRGRVYSGEVDYDGQTTGTPPVVKVKSDTDYTGLAVALDFTHPLPAPAGPEVALRFGIGVDHWRRHILDSGGISGVEERYTIPSVTVGLVLHPEVVTGWYAQGGVKIPFATREEVSNFGSFDDFTLNPEPDFSLYADLGYRFNERWDAALYYDGYRFKKSDAERLTVGGADSGYEAWQPESRQDAWGVRVRYWF